MKLSTALVSASLVVASFSFSFSAQANEQLALSLCEYVAANDKGGLRKKLKSSRLKIRNIFDAHPFMSLKRSRHGQYYTISLIQCSR